MPPLVSCTVDDFLVHATSNKQQALPLFVNAPATNRFAADDAPCRVVNWIEVGAVWLPLIGQMTTDFACSRSHIVSCFQHTRGQHPYCDILKVWWKLKVVCGFCWKFSWKLEIQFWNI